MVITNLILDDQRIVIGKTKEEPKADTSGFPNVEKQDRYRNATANFDISTEYDAQEMEKPQCSARKQVQKS